MALTTTKKIHSNITIVYSIQIVIPSSLQPYFSYKYNESGYDYWIHTSVTSGDYHKYGFSNDLYNPYTDQVAASNGGYYPCRFRYNIADNSLYLDFTTNACLYNYSIRNGWSIANSSDIPRNLASFIVDNLTLEDILIVKTDYTNNDNYNDKNIRPLLSTKNNITFTVGSNYTIPTDFTITYQSNIALSIPNPPVGYNFRNDINSQVNNSIVIQYTTANGGTKDIYPSSTIRNGSNGSNAVFELNFNDSNINLVDYNNLITSGILFVKPNVKYSTFYEPKQYNKGTLTDNNITFSSLLTSESKVISITSSDFGCYWQKYFWINLDDSRVTYYPDTLTDDHNYTWVKEANNHKYRYEWSDPNNEPPATLDSQFDLVSLDLTLQYEYYINGTLDLENMNEYQSTAAENSGGGNIPNILNTVISQYYIYSINFTVPRKVDPIKGEQSLLQCNNSSNSFNIGSTNFPFIFKETQAVGDNNIDTYDLRSKSYLQISDITGNDQDILSLFDNDNTNNLDLAINGSQFVQDVAGYIPPESIIVNDFTQDENDNHYIINKVLTIADFSIVRYTKTIELTLSGPFIYGPNDEEDTDHTYIDNTFNIITSNAFNRPFIHVNNKEGLTINSEYNSENHKLTLSITNNVAYPEITESELSFNNGSNENEIAVNRDALLRFIQLNRYFKIDSIQKDQGNLLEFNQPNTNTISANVHINFRKYIIRTNINNTVYKNIADGVITDNHMESYLGYLTCIAYEPSVYTEDESQEPQLITSDELTFDILGLQEQNRQLTLDDIFIDSDTNITYVKIPADYQPIYYNVVDINGIGDITINESEDLDLKFKATIADTISRIDNGNILVPLVEQGSGNNYPTLDITTYRYYKFSIYSPFHLELSGINGTNLIIECPKDNNDNYITDRKNSWSYKVYAQNTRLDDSELCTGWVSALDYEFGVGNHPNTSVQNKNKSLQYWVSKTTGDTCDMPLITQRPILGIGMYNNASQGPHANETRTAADSVSFTWGRENNNTYYLMLNDPSTDSNNAAYYNEVTAGHINYDNRILIAKILLALYVNNRIIKSNDYYHFESIEDILSNSDYLSFSSNRPIDNEDFINGNYHDVKVSALPNTAEITFLYDDILNDYVTKYEYENNINPTIKFTYHTPLGDSNLEHYQYEEDHHIYTVNDFFGTTGSGLYYTKTNTGKVTITGTGIAGSYIYDNSKSEQAKQNDSYIRNIELVSAIPATDTEPAKPSYNKLILSNGIFPISSTTSDTPFYEGKNSYVYTFYYDIYIKPEIDIYVESLIKDYYSKYTFDNDSNIQADVITNKVVNFNGLDIIPELVNGNLTLKDYRNNETSNVIASKPIKNDNYCYDIYKNEYFESIIPQHLSLDAQHIQRLNFTLKRRLINVSIDYQYLTDNFYLEGTKTRAITLRTEWTNNTYPLLGTRTINNGVHLDNGQPIVNWTLLAGSPLVNTHTLSTNNTSYHKYANNTFDEHTTDKIDPYFYLPNKEANYDSIKDGVTDDGQLIGNGRKFDKWIDSNNNDIIFNNSTDNTYQYYIVSNDINITAKINYPQYSAYLYYQETTSGHTSTLSTQRISFTFEKGIPFNISTTENGYEIANEVYYDENCTKRVSLHTIDGKQYLIEPLFGSEGIYDFEEVDMNFFAKCSVEAYTLQVYLPDSTITDPVILANINADESVLLDSDKLGSFSTNSEGYSFIGWANKEEVADLEENKWIIGSTDELANHSIFIKGQSYTNLFAIDNNTLVGYTLVPIMLKSNLTACINFDGGYIDSELTQFRGNLNIQYSTGSFPTHYSILYDYLTNLYKKGYHLETDSAGNYKLYNYVEEANSFVVDDNTYFTVGENGLIGNKKILNNNKSLDNTSFNSFWQVRWEPNSYIINYANSALPSKEHTVDETPFTIAEDFESISLPTKENYVLVGWGIKEADNKYKFMYAPNLKIRNLVMSITNRDSITLYPLFVKNIAHLQGRIFKDGDLYIDTADNIILKRTNKSWEFYDKLPVHAN